MQRSDLTTAQTKAEQEFKYYSGRDASRAMQFRMLEAEILTFGGRSQDVVTLLSDSTSAYPAAGDIAIKRTCSAAWPTLIWANCRRPTRNCRKRGAFPNPATPS